MDADFAMFQELLNNSKTEEGVWARFYDRSVKTEQIGKDGLPVFENRTFVEIRTKNNTTDIYDQPADQEKIKRFPVEYQRYKIEKKQNDNGSPINQFAFLDAAQIDSLRVRGIFTVETLAELPDDKAKDLNITTERNLAKKFLDNAKDNKALVEWEKKEAEYTAEIEALQKKIAKLQAKLEEMATASKK